ncbi:MAG TPA: aconitate hydratase [Syntrophales bacterium]|nr:aconitate hydratase [Syntrophales bacterium]
MGKTITQKIIEAHLVSGNAIPDNEIGIRIDQTLTQDATGTMAYLQFESMGVSAIKTDLSVSYIDHNTVQIGFENADDHRYLRNIAQKYGIHLSRPGNGICHQVHLERFGKPGATLIGADSHTPTAGALGMLAIGVGGLDVALAMAGEPFYFVYPRTIKINLTGSLQPWVSAKDIILRVLQIFTTKGNVGRVFEYGGQGTAALSVPERATIANMGAECGVTTSIFPGDEMTKAFLKAEKRVADWREISADRDSVYERIVDINLSELEPMTAKPHSPDNIGTVRDMEKIEVQQVCLGSCTNSSYVDLATAACILKGRVVHPDVSFIIAPGSKQVLENIERDGYLADLISSGARFMENACGFCIGNSQSPSTKGVSLRTSNRNFPGRSGTKDADVYLVSPETAVAAVITGTFTDPRDLGIPYPKVKMPAEFHIDDRMIIKPDVKTTGGAVRIHRGPNIGDPPAGRPLPDVISGEVTIKVGNNITTDHIMPAGDLMKYRSNISKYAEFVFAPIDRKFSLRAKKIRDEGRHNFIVAGLSYGQGSSREQAAICPMHLGVKAIIARSFERIHVANLINFGILPLTIDEDAYNSLSQGDLLAIENIRSILAKRDKVVVKNLSRQVSFEAANDFSERQKMLLLAGGALNLR